MIDMNKQIRLQHKRDKKSYFKVNCHHLFTHQLIGGPPNPGQDSTDNLVSVFISKVIDPENPYGTSDSVRILLLQFAALLVERAAPHIHDAADK